MISQFLNTYFQSILQLSDDGALGDERKELTLDGVGKRDDESQENAHLKHQEEEYLK